MIALLLAAAVTQFDPIAFFRGRTQGDGTIKIVLRAPMPLKVESLGYSEADGTLIIKQVIREGSKPPRTRFWRLKDGGSGKFSGTLTDAASPVRIEQTENSIRIRYKDKDNLDFDQTLTPAGAKTLRNRMKVRRFGIIVAHIDETIRKVD